MIAFSRGSLNLYIDQRNCYDADYFFQMINYILLYKIRKRVKKLLKEKISDEEIATTPKSCIGCLADEISWEIYHMMKEEKEA